MRLSATVHVTLIQYLSSRYPEPRYLEIGCQNNACFDGVEAAHKVGVDPASGGTHRMTSDQFFSLPNPDTYDVVFIDGLHTAEQAGRDLEHSLPHLAPNGVAVLHDVLPPNEDWTEPDLCGDVWRLVPQLAARQDIDLALWPKDVGCALVVQRPSPKQRVSTSFSSYAERVRALGDWNEVSAWLGQ